MNKFIAALLVLAGTFTIACNALAEETITLPETVIIVKKPVSAVPKKAYVCSAPRPLVQGPIGMQVRTCEWK